MKYVDYYAALGIGRDADLAQIKAAYRKLAHLHHPDVSKDPDAEAKFKSAAAAYATLKNPEKRAAYDQLGVRAEGAEMDGPGQRPASDGFEGNRGDFADMDLSDFLNAMDAQHRSAARSPRRGEDFVDTVKVDLTQTVLGCTLHLSLTEHGEIRELEVKIPPGVQAGQKVRLRGKGGKGSRGGEDGDFYLQIALKPHAVFRVDQHDLYFDLALSPWEAALGAEISVPTLEGEVLLTVPKGSSSGRKLRLRGRGLPMGLRTENRRGDLYAQVRIEVPSALTAAEQKLFEELSRISLFAPRRPSIGVPHDHPPY